jgi:hypothetical protein
VKIDEQQISQRDGTSQASRRQAALDPTHVPIDERSVEDLLAFVGTYAEELRYFNEQNEVDGDWSALLNDNPDVMAHYLADPEQFQAEATSTLYTRPHVVLLLTFLKLLQYAQTQMNDLTRRHLEFYYREALRLASRLPTADRVHVLIELVANQPQFRLPAGSLLHAGQDSQGLDRFYRTDHDLIANQGHVASLKSVLVQKQVIGIREVHHDPEILFKIFPAAKALWSDLSKPNRVFMALLSMALGEANPGGILPPYPATQKMPDLLLLQNLDALITFIRSDLAMSLGTFRALMELKHKRDTADQEWEAVNALLKKAATKRSPGFEWDNTEPRNFEKRLLAALGRTTFDGFFGTLPEVDDIYDLYHFRVRAAVRSFIEADKLYLSFDDFTRMLSIIDDIYKDWRHIYDILRTAARRKHPEGQLISPNLRAYDADMFNTLIGQTLGSLTFPKIGIPLGSLDDCYRQLLNLEAYFQMPIEDFATIRAINAREDQAKPWEREYMDTLLERVYATRALASRRERLRSSHATNGFEALIRLLLGDPKPGDPLPELRDFMRLNPIKDETYIRKQLYLEITNFSYIHSTALSKALDDPAWDQVYQILELAEHRKRGWQEPQAQIEQWQHIYAATDATQVLVQSDQPAEAATPRWRTFGAAPSLPDQTYLVPAAAGFAIASPLLALAEGKRTISLKLGFAADHFDETAIKAALEHHPFRFFLSSQDGMIEVIPRLSEDSTPETVAIEANKDTLLITLRLNDQAPPVTPLTASDGIPTPWPVLQIALGDVANNGHIIYRAVQPLVLQNVELRVEVAGITRLTLQNDEGVLNPKQPFEPFGFAPVVGSSFSIAHPELCSKQLSRLEMQIDWLGPPDNFHKYYLGYHNYDKPSAPADSPIATNKSFLAQLRLYDNRACLDIARLQLFHADADDPTIGAKQTQVISLDTASEQPVYLGNQPARWPVIAEEVLDWSRYWQLELVEHDFQHAIYPQVAAARAAKATITDGQPLLVNPPYTPKIKRLAINYSAAEEIQLAGNTGETASMLYHIEPFGYRELSREEDNQYYFLPQHPHEGELLIGLAGLVPPQNLALLFQMAEDSAHPDLPPETVHWRYLDGNHWRSLESGRLLSDTTNGLLNTGIITFDLPPVTPSTRLPGDLYWVQATIAKHSRSVADLIAIRAQAVSATFADQGNAPDHLSQPLPPESITGLAEPQPEVRAIHQPYSSIGGHSAEQASHFYTRVSERLRHKNRALTSWDYERLILEAFPEIYKVKCLPVGTTDDPRLADQIRIIVIPDIRGKLPFDPFEPKVPADTLLKIKQYLSGRIPAAARFTVSNPTYTRLKVRLVVRLKPGCNPGYYRPALDQELQHYLAPWAYDQSAEIVFGGKINASLIVNFVAERPYVDYVAGIKLLQAPAGNTYHPITTEFVVPSDVILVSDRQHQIDVISGEGYQEEHFMGINYLQIELDFQVE